MDKPLKSFMISILRGLIIIIPFIFLLAFLFDMAGVWLSLAVTESIVMAVAIKFLSKKGGCIHFM